jgi:class 3 adenylate cyclase
VPGLWSESALSSPIGGRGVATYRLHVRLPPDASTFSVAVGGPLTAHRLWIDGVERGGLGRVGETAETTQAVVFNRVYELDRGVTDVELQVQVANFAFRGGGLRRPWYVGHTDSVQRGVGRAVLREASLFAVGVVVGLGYLVLFALRPTERARGWFGLMALVLGLRAVPASISSFGELIAPWASFELLVRTEYLGLGLAFFAATGYTRTKIAGIMPPRTTELLAFVALAFSAIVALAPFPIVLATLPLQWALPPVLIGLVIAHYGRAWRRGVADAGVTAVTAALYAGFVVHDIIRNLRSGLGTPVELFPYAMALWILAEAYQLLRGFQQSFEQVESLSEALGEANFEIQETEAAIVRFVPFDFLRSLGKQSIREVEAGDHATIRMSVLQCGLRTSTTSAERADEPLAFARVNALLARIEPCVHERGGFLSDYRNDGFQAFFPGGPSDAVSAALAMREAAREPEAGSPPGGRPELELTVGIDTGSLELGTIGSGEHLVRGVIGEPVERARRIEALASRSGRPLLISEATREGLDDDGPFELRAVADGACIAAIGVQPVFEVVGRRSSSSRVQSESAGA